MTLTEWQAFCILKAKFKYYCIESLKKFEHKYSAPRDVQEPSPSKLTLAIKKVVFDSPLSKKITIPPYKIETPIVYNHSIDEIKQNDEIKLILVGDNPGKKEQEHKNQRYLVGQSGSIADNFFKKNSELEIDFRKNVIILNKSILHTPKTMLLKELIKEDKLVEEFFVLDQNWQAQYAILLQKLFSCPLWIVGYSQLGKKGLFEHYATRIKVEYSHFLDPPFYLYQHFSMNCFVNQFKKTYNSNLTFLENLKGLGKINRKNIFGF